MSSKLGAKLLSICASILERVAAVFSLHFGNFERERDRKGERRQERKRREKKTKKWETERSKNEPEKKENVEKEKIHKSTKSLFRYEPPLQDIQTIRMYEVHQNTVRVCPSHVPSHTPPTNLDTIRKVSFTMRWQDFQFFFSSFFETRMFAPSQMFK